MQLMFPSAGCHSWWFCACVSACAEQAAALFTVQGCNLTLDSSTFANNHLRNLASGGVIAFGTRTEPRSSQLSLSIRLALFHNNTL
jgi:hypothetical protein